MTFRLPPLNTLRLFEAAGRHLSFTLAAEELHITPSAVSHGIHNLEVWLGVPLFRRGPRSLQLTEAGRSYLPALQAALATLAAATEAVSGRRPTGEIAVTVAPTFAGRWLLPRLARFAGSRPDVVVSIDTARHQLPFPADGLDLAIRMATAPRQGGTWHRLVRESLVPVCAPAIAADAARLSMAAFLTGTPLIHVTGVSEDWKSWLGRAGIRRPGSPHDLHVDTIQMALDAARQGFGVALGRKPLIDDEVAQGHLVEVCGPPQPGNTSYWLVGTEAAFERPEIRQFRRWLLREMRQAAEPIAAISA